MDISGLNMKTGNDLIIHTDTEYILDNIYALMGVFIEDAIGLGSCYCTHSNRTVVQKKDIGLALKTRAFHGDEFWNRQDIQQKINEMKELMDETESESGSDDMEVDDMEVDDMEVDDTEVDDMEVDEEWTKSECNCEICNCLNNIESKWESWNPTSKTDIILKNAIKQSLRE
jgi:hypothetical protein